MIIYVYLHVGLPIGYQMVPQLGCNKKMPTQS